MAEFKNTEITSDIKVKIESDFEIADEQPDSYKTRENILEFEETAIFFTKSERNDQIGSYRDTEDIELKNENDLHLKEEPNHLNARENITECEEVKIQCIKSELKDLKVLIKNFVDFTCIACGSALDISRPMRVWKQKHEPVEFLCKDCCKKRICVECDSAFANKTNLNAHIDAVHKILKKYNCKQCDKAFRYVQSLYRHINAIHRKLTYACQQCDKTFSQRDSLNIHINFLHRRSINITCRECHKAFSNKHRHKRHVDGVHRKIKQHQCLECKSAFFNITDLKVHVDTVHRKLKRFVCQKCNHTFTQRCNLNRHVRTVHLNLKNFVCSECNRGFFRKDYLIKHIKSVHKTS